MKHLKQEDPLKDFFSKNAFLVPVAPTEAKTRLLEKIKAEEAPKSFWQAQSVWAMALVLVFLIGSLTWHFQGQKQDSYVSQEDYIESSFAEYLGGLEEKEDAIGADYLALAETI
ncbi:MAG: hypothetical protein KDK66_03050 [Deltaproteobacteria bacterium]|nr:hypothetical protein [Deltaproteobacteria bacterium]